MPPAKQNRSTQNESFVIPTSQRSNPPTFKPSDLAPATGACPERSRRSALDASFTTQRQDTVPGLYDFPAREYSIQGRWPSPDPAGLASVDPSNPQSWNRYAYVLNDPMDNVDPLGLCPNGKPCTPRNNGPICINPAARANGGCTKSIPCTINFIGCLPFTNDPSAVNCSLDGVDTSCGALGSGTISVWATSPCTSLDAQVTGTCPPPYFTTINLGDSPSPAWAAIKTFFSLPSTGPGSCFALFQESIEPLDTGFDLKDLAEGVSTGSANLNLSAASAAVQLRNLAKAGALDTNLGPWAITATTAVSALSGKVAVLAEEFAPAAGELFTVAADSVLLYGNIKEARAAFNGQCKP